MDVSVRVVVVAHPDVEASVQHILHGLHLEREDELGIPDGVDGVLADLRGLGLRRCSYVRI